MEELGQYNETLLQKCCTINEYGLDQFDYLVFTQGRQNIFDSMDLADSDHRVVRSNIVGHIGTALGSANGDLIRDNTSEITQTLQKRSTNMVISFDTSSYQDGLTCNAFMGVCVNRCISYHR
ncbi:AIS_HP2_G0020370.mRNA.1.CDS.1 [Saccharomyces cerevisiae]|nr:AIS_HP2_G0020370.mRNA.1.CDS.1 [Saccharomyces cerevisiae]CAI6526859.1 AIS_HP2_G0020370.mRNA.1.CDS.1 [Saccharomyces cerevisiae]